MSAALSFFHLDFLQVIHPVQLVDAVESSFQCFSPFKIVVTVMKTVTTIALLFSRVKSDVFLMSPLVQLLTTFCHIIVLFYY